MATRNNSVTDQALSDRIDTTETGVNDIGLVDNGDGTYTFSNPTSGQTTGISLNVDNLQDVTLTGIKNSDSLRYFGGWVNRSPNDGQIKINTGTGGSQPTFTLVANVAQSLQYIPPLSVSGFPTSSIPLNNGTHPITFVDSLIYQSARFVENDVSGQVNIWRFILDYSGKQSGNSGVITVIINNALSGFTAKGSFPLPQGVTAETDRYTEIITIADSASLPSGTGQGYDFSIEASTDCDVVVTSVTRVTPQYTERV